MFESLNGRIFGVAPCFTRCALRFLCFTSSVWTSLSASLTSPTVVPKKLTRGTGSELFTAAQGTDLLCFFAGVFERAMRRWLS